MAKEFASHYMHELDEHSSQVRAKKDLKTIVKFIGDREPGNTLDIGAENPLKIELSKWYGLEIDGTGEKDLDVDELSGIYDTVFCFEVIEHLFNPLFLLLQIRKVLKDDGLLFLSTPRRRPHHMWYKYHFHEFSQQELINIVKRAGFKINRIEYMHSARPLLGYFKGIRSFLRIFIERKCLLELGKTSKIEYRTHSTRVS